MAQAAPSPSATPPSAPSAPPPPELVGPRGAVETPALETWQIGVLALAGALALALVLLIVRRRLRQRQAGGPSMPPEDAARAEIEVAWENAADDERFALLLANAVRRYASERLGLRALEQSTEEFRRALLDHPAGGPDTAERCAAFLARCDRVKFARGRLNSAEREALASEARALAEALEGAARAEEADKEAAASG